jgi:competence protein ComEC
MALRQADGSLSLLRGRAGDYVRDVLAQSAGEGDMAAPTRESTGAASAEHDRTADQTETAQNGAPWLALSEAPNARCSRDMCSALVHGRSRDWLIVATHSRVRLPWAALIELCARADIIVSDRRLPAACTPRWLKLDRARLGETGGVAVYFESGRWTSVRTAGDRHPWILQPYVWKSGLRTPRTASAPTP